MCLRRARRRFVLPALLLLWLPLSLRAQIVDDSTKVLYGAKTTRVLYEADILREQYEGRIVDTTLTSIHQQRNWFHDSTFQQDLGNVGTASHRLLWQTNTQLGARLGRTVFDKYARDAATIPFYDTKSPYTFFRYNQSGVGEQVFELSYSRSIGRQANIGMAFERFASNKSVATAPGNREAMSEHNNVLFFTRFQSKDDRYHALASFGTARHRAVEQGGIRPQPTDSFPRDLFGYDRERVWLTQALNRDDRDQGRLVHTYRLLGRGLTVYHLFDWSRQLNKYTDTFTPAQRDAQGRLLFYPPAPRLSNIGTDDRAELRQLENAVGVLGRTEAVEYRLYARYRNGRLISRALVGENGLNEPGVVRPILPDATFGQLFVGGTAAFRYRSLVAVQTAGELKPSATLGQTEYWLRATARLGPLSGELLNSSYAPTLTQQRFSGNHYAWDHTVADSAFDNTNVQQLSARLAQTLGRQRLELSGSVVNIAKLVYYNQNARPAQLTGSKQLLIGTLRHWLQLGHVFADNQATYTYSPDERGVRIPRLVTNSKLYYQSYIFKKALFSQVGVEMYYQSKFKGYAYSPSTQQFYLQDAFTIRNYPLVDVYLNTDIKTVSLFLKMAYVNQYLLNKDGYFTTPYYTGLPRRFQFGLRWQFFD
ncbi:Putative porin [Hymenobacter daecheongensis DSM 21074]|uniref:Putative porin n=1 Tax=Hymenobacter daecheongensis DSM 21074 TaxID=1121955 RepID=A0A1M6HPF3_9BACT|nr:putative porin [Hymenobacter daecheongensis]SHJ24050.1 Putative porin [Hymenobacter daecheongensis DSM 21074]